MNQESLNSKQRRLIRRYNERNVKDDTTSLAGITEDFTKQNKQTNIENNTNIDKKNVLQKDSGEGKIYSRKVQMKKISQRNPSKVQKKKQFKKILRKNHPNLRKKKKSSTL